MTASPSSTESGMSHWLPYALTAVGLFLGLGVLLFEPFAVSALNTAIGWGAVAVSFGSVFYLVARHGGPGERGPDF